MSTWAGSRLPAVKRISRARLRRKSKRVTKEATAAGEQQGAEDGGDGDEEAVPEESAALPDWDHASVRDSPGSDCAARRSSRAARCRRRDAARCRPPTAGGRARRRRTVARSRRRPVSRRGRDGEASGAARRSSGTAERGGAWCRHASSLPERSAREERADRGQGDHQQGPRRARSRSRCGRTRR